MKKSMLILIVILPQLGFSWGFWAHQEINRLAVFTLPPEMIPFFKEHIEFITEHAVDPDKRRYVMEGEANKHYIDLDHFCTFPCNDFPKEWDDAVATFTEDTLYTYGTVPWAIERYCFYLTKAFEEKDGNKILKYAAELGHYIGDSHVPLHTTENYNGQLTNQKGIHGFWESRLPELFHDNYDYFVGKATYQSNINHFVWQEVMNAHSHLETVLLEEKKLDSIYPSNLKYSYETRGQTTVRTYSQGYSEAYHNALMGMVEEQMRRSIKHTGDLWFTCWVNAGQPNLKDVRFNLESINMLTKKNSETKRQLKTRLHAQDGLSIFQNEYEKD